METAQSTSKSSFFTAHVVPVLFVFLIPGFSAWYFNYAEGWMDQKILKQVEAEIQSAPNMTEARATQALNFYRKVPVSRIMASRKAEVAPIQALFAPVKARYAAFRWMKRLAWICLATILATFVIVGLSVALSFRSQAAQYWALRVGWPVLRTSASIQVLGQGLLAVALSYWVTAIGTGSYFPKLIVVIGIMAITAVLALFKAIFAKLDDRFEVAGEIISEADAPTLWQRVREMAARLDTAAPDRIIVGILPNFFVTEHPVTLGSDLHQGRTLYLSLPMLKVLAVDEADAVLGHELAHFSGQDTLWSRKVSPLMAKFGVYMVVLANGMSLIVAHFMAVFWKLYGLSLGRLSRAREFRADKIGAELVSLDAMKHALIKITCYCDYRAKMEQTILEKQRIDEGLNLSLQLEQGYAASLSGFANGETVADERVPHPFDTHPTLNNRLAQLGFEASAALRDGGLQEPAANSWYHAIRVAPEMEQRLWTQQQQYLQIVHSMDLAWRLLPKDEEETAIVLEHFPQIVFHRKDGTTATLEFDRLKLSGWTASVFFKDIVSLKLENCLMGKRLTLAHRREGKKKPVQTRFYPSKYIGQKGTLLTLFEQYYARHKTAEAKASAG
jgi:Zn-dependent protease with chaperone function